LLFVCIVFRTSGTNFAVFFQFSYFEMFALGFLFTAIPSTVQYKTLKSERI
jgi:hypothetical protein